MESSLKFIRAYNPFALFIRYVFSQNSIVQGSTVLMLARTIETQQLFNKVYPAALMGESRLIASWSMALGIEWGILMVTVNSRFTAKYNHVVYAISSVVMTMLFLGILKSFPSLEFYINVTYLSLVSGYSLYSFCEILVEKNKAQILEIEALEKLKQVEIQLSSSIDEVTFFKEKLSSNDQALLKAEFKVSEYEKQIEALREQVTLLADENEEQRRKASRKRPLLFEPMKTGT